MSNREETPLSPDSTVEGRGNSLETARSESRDSRAEEPASGNSGRPVKGKNGIVGWMTDHEAADSKVSGVTFVVNCYVIYFVAGDCITSFGVIVSLTSVSSLDKYTIRHRRGDRRASEQGEDSVASKNQGGSG